MRPIEQIRGDLFRKEKESGFWDRYREVPTEHELEDFIMVGEANYPWLNLMAEKNKRRGHWQGHKHKRFRTVPGNSEAA